MKKALIILGLVLIIIVALFFANKSLPIDVYVNSGAHMQPTINDGEKFVAGEKNNYKRFDIVIIDSKGLRPDEYLIKRIIGLPSEKISIKDGEVYINGSLLNEPYSQGDTLPNSDMTLAQDQYYVMGDNRNVSADSRLFGPVTQNRLLGKVVKVN